MNWKYIPGKALFFLKFSLQLEFRSSRSFRINPIEILTRNNKTFSRCWKTKSHSKGEMISKKTSSGKNGSRPRAIFNPGCPQPLFTSEHNTLSQIFTPASDFLSPHTTSNSSSDAARWAKHHPADLEEVAHKKTGPGQDGASVRMISYSI